MEREIIPVFTTDPTVRARCAGVGVLTGDEALAWGALGPVARASGLPQDIRKAQPYEIYDRLDFEVPVRPEGDVLARIVARPRDRRELPYHREGRRGPADRADRRG
jgi:NADH:ubiquinone oxidoreductase subunit D